MLELIAEGAEIGSRWRRQIPDHEIFVGRATESYRVPWDSQISRVHVSLCSVGDKVRTELADEWRCERELAARHEEEARARGERGTGGARSTGRSRAARISAR